MRNTISKIPIEPDCDVWARYMVRMREMKESHKIVAQALARLKPGPVKADAPKVVLPDREAMKTHMDALIHHFLIVAEGFDVPAGEVYQPIEASKGELGCVCEIRRWTKARARAFPWTQFCKSFCAAAYVGRRNGGRHRRDHRIVGYCFRRDRSVTRTLAFGLGSLDFEYPG